MGSTGAAFVKILRDASSFDRRRRPTAIGALRGTRARLRPGTVLNPPPPGSAATAMLGRFSPRIARMAVSLGRRGSSQAERREGRITEGWRAERILACPFLLAHHGAWHRHLGTQCRVPAQHAAHASKLCAALGAGWTIRPSSIRPDILLGTRSARPILFQQAGSDGERNRAPSCHRSRQS